MFKKQVAYQLEAFGDAVVISEDGMKIYRKGKVLVNLNEEQMDKIVEEYEEINR